MSTELSTELQRSNLFDFETTLVALTEVDYQELTPELRAQWETELVEALQIAPEKRERVAERITTLLVRAAQKEGAAAEYKAKADSLQAGANGLRAEAEKLRAFVAMVLASIPKPKRGARRLEGIATTFVGKEGRGSVEVDETLLPEEYKTATVTMSVAQWRLLVWLLNEDLVLLLCDGVAEARGDELRTLAVAFRALRPTWGRVGKDELKEQLQKERPCNNCAGDGATRIAPNLPAVICEACQGKKLVKSEIPGVRLVQGKLSVSIE